MLDKHPFIFVCEHPVISSIINLAQKQTNKKLERRTRSAVALRFFRILLKDAYGANRILSNWNCFKKKSTE